MTEDFESPLDLAVTVFTDNPPVRMDDRAATYFLVAATLLKKDASEQERLRALGLLETGLYPEGRSDSLFKALTGKEPPKRRERGRGGDPRAHFARDLMILYVIKTVGEVFGLKPFRSRAAKDKGGAESGCSVVVEALKRVNVHMTEGAVEKIWNARRSLSPAVFGPAPFV